MALARKLRNWLKADLEKAWSKATLSLYQKHWEEFTNFAITLDQSPLPASKELVSLYVAYIRNTLVLKATTIQSRLSAISHYHSMSDFDSPTSSYVIDSLIASYSKNDSPPAIRKAITKDILLKILESINSRENAYSKKLYCAMICLMYHGLLRCSEVTHSTKCNHNLKSSQVTLEKGSRLKITFISYKHSKPNPPPLLIRPPGDASCPYTAVKRYLKVRPQGPEPVFCNQNGRPVSRNQLVCVLKTHLAFCGKEKLNFNTHSLRMGKATDMHHAGYTDPQIAKAGRWSSTAFMRYIKPNLIVV